MRRIFWAIVALIAIVALVLFAVHPWTSTSTDDAIDNELLRQSVQEVADSKCSDNSVAELREAASLIATATDEERQVIFELNQSLEKVDDVDRLKDALVAKANECEEAATAAPTPATPSPTATDCPAEFVQVAIDRTETTQVDPRYGQKVAEIRAQNLSPDEFKAAIDNLELELAGTNGQTLAALAASAGLYDPSNDWRELVEGGVVVDGGCLTQEGQELYAMFKGAITATGTKVEVVEAPQNMTNSGIRNGDTYVVATIPGIVGPNETVRYTFVDGTVVYHVVVCMNPLWIAPPPGVPTEPNITPTTTPPTTSSSTSTTSSSTSMTSSLTSTTSGSTSTTSGSTSTTSSSTSTTPSATTSPTTASAKVAALEPQVQGNNVTGGAGVAPAADETASSPAAGTAPQEYVPAATPAPEPIPAAPVAPDEPPAPAPEPVPTDPEGEIGDPGGF